MNRKESFFTVFIPADYQMGHRVHWCLSKLLRSSALIYWTSLKSLRATFLIFVFFLQEIPSHLWEKQNQDTFSSDTEKRFLLVFYPTLNDYGVFFREKQWNLIVYRESSWLELFKNSVIFFRENFLPKNYGFQKTLPSSVIAVPSLVSKKLLTVSLKI